MTRRPSAAHALSEQAARAVAAALDDAPAAAAEIEAELPAEAPAGSASRGRPKGKREVEARLTLYLDARRHEALRRLAADRGRSIHSLLIEAIDAITGKPAIKPWE